MHLSALTLLPAVVLLITSATATPAMSSVAKREMISSLERKENCYCIRPGDSKDKCKRWSVLKAPGYCPTMKTAVCCDDCNSHGCDYNNLHGGAYGDDDDNEGSSNGDDDDDGDGSGNKVEVDKDKEDEDEDVVEEEDPVDDDDDFK
ncbi:hypothetical protein CPB85DRAFT_1307425 [Mucidula mucida]|nr:hypothetical protein CPB85DRAFT_1307425 [Mucidula mucida]